MSKRADEMNSCPRLNTNPCRLCWTQFLVEFESAIILMIVTESISFCLFNERFVSAIIDSQSYLTVSA